MGQVNGSRPLNSTKPAQFRMSVVRDLILQADDDLRYPTSGELRTMVDFLDQGAMRVSVVKVLTENEKKIVDESAKQLFGRKPEYVAPGGNAYGQRQRAQCLRDYSWYLRLITYGVLAGSTEMIQEIGLVGARDVQQPWCSDARNG